MSTRMHRTRTWAFSSLLLSAHAGPLGCAPSTNSASDAGNLATAPNLNQPHPLDGGHDAASPSPRGPDASLTPPGLDAAANGSNDTPGPAQTGANFSLPGFGGFDAGTPTTDFATTNVSEAQATNAPPSSGATGNGDAGETLVASSVGASYMDASYDASTMDLDAGAPATCIICPASDDACWAYVCNPLTELCEAKPNVGAECDDGNACTTVDVCAADGQCRGATKDCPASDDECTVNTCNPDSGSCQPQPLPTTTTCDDGDRCTVSDHCDGAGQCEGNAKDCSELNDQCLTGRCNIETGACEALPSHLGEGCDDGDECTVEDQCDETGACGGGAKDCTEYDGECVIGVCAAADGACEPKNRDDGLACDDQSSCTTNDVCKNGACGGVVPDTCSSGGSLGLVDGSVTLTVDTSCTGVEDQFNVATDAESASGDDCSQSTGPDVYLLLDLSSYTEDVRVRATTDQSSTLFDTVLILMGSDASTAEQCGYTKLAACNDDISRDKKQSRIDVVVPPGMYALVVDGFISSKNGAVGLAVTVTPP